MDFHKQVAHLELSNLNKDGCRKTNESDNDQSMKNCDQILSGKVGIGMSTGRRHHLHLQQIGGSQENGMNHNKENGKINNGGKKSKYNLSSPSVLLQESWTFVALKNISRTDIGECRARDGG